jgi:GNAT superfamily N-acetyltransferase
MFHPVTVADVDVLRKLAERTFRDAWQASNDPEHFEAYCNEAFTNDKLAAEIQHPGSEFFLIIDQDTPAAYIKLNFDKQPVSLEPGPNVQLERIYVLEAYQSRGLGSYILDFIEQRAREAGAEWLWLSVWEKSPRSIRFYEQNGYTIFGTETFWVGNDPQEDWLMKRKVKSEK